MVKKGSPAPTIPPEHQPDAVLDQENPVSGTKYTVLDTTKNVRLIGVAVKCTWTAQPTPLQVHITINGESWNWYQFEPTSDTWYTVRDIDLTVATDMALCASRTTIQPYVLEGRGVKIEVEITGGTVSNLGARVKWAKW